jgi:hypothetical protein
VKWNISSQNASAIEVTRDGQPWIVSKGNKLSTYDGSNWTEKSDSATAIGASTSAHVWKLGDCGVKYLKGDDWIPLIDVDGKPVKIDVDEEGTAYVVND